MRDGGDKYPREDSIGRWRVRQYVGAGAYGTVLQVVEAGHPEQERRALKLAHAPGSPRFEREAALLSRLQHAHVPRLYEVGVWTSPEAPRYPYLVMEWVEGVGLYEWPRRHALTSRTAMRVLAQLARALEATHALGALHRDVKGDNIRVSPEGQAKLLDFGACWYPGAQRLTEGVAPGTEPYRSPQVLRARWLYQQGWGRGPVYAPSDDVYALGVTAYRWLTGRYPEAGRMMPPSKLATVSPELEKLILRMLSKRARARGRARELAQALEEAALSGGTEADLLVVPRALPVKARGSPSAGRRGPVTPSLLHPSTTTGQPLSTASGTSRATFRAMPAVATASTTRSTSLYAVGASSASSAFEGHSTRMPRALSALRSSAPTT